MDVGRRSYAEGPLSIGLDASGVRWRCAFPLATQDPEPAQISRSALVIGIHAAPSAGRTPPAMPARNATAMPSAATPPSTRKLDATSDMVPPLNVPVWVK